MVGTVLREPALTAVRLAFRFRTKFPLASAGTAASVFWAQSEGAEACVMGEHSNAALDNVALTELHGIYVAICDELGIGEDAWRRDLVASVVMDLARGGERDVGAIHQRAIIKLINRKTLRR